MHAQLRNYLDTWRSTAQALGLVRPIGFQERPETLAAMQALPESETIAKLQDGELFTPTGPTWYRGQALCYRYTETENLENALAKLGVKRVIEGHTVSPIGRVLSRFEVAWSCSTPACSSRSTRAGPRHSFSRLGLERRVRR